eukprot:CAMPEP_0167746404 /NCGR_PEP_ID=MMETSP0110_2-20121227/3694_1 /TAXON_ID=629695 /ORGANISM="Gymnochlora sp., Strain CCMP2014" /LENGTH=245 /DNA_ID=CAMNT_0007631165 /DNA_START=484 /DNA_END=1221 /DNA_ORIENTATION=-
MFQLDISLIINNAGTSRKLPEDFHTIGFKELSRIVTVNAHSSAIVTKLALEQLLRRNRGTLIEPASSMWKIISMFGFSSRPRRGGIIVVSSITAIFESPGMSGYAATKAFDRQLARSLALEYSNRGVDILALTPAYVQTPLSGAKSLGGFPPVVSSLACANGALDSLGYETETTGHWRHDLQKTIMDLTPRWILDSEILEEMNRFSERKRRYLDDLDEKSTMTRSIDASVSFPIEDDADVKETFL